MKDKKKKGRIGEMEGETVEQTRKIIHEIDPSVMLKLTVGTGGLLDLFLRRSCEEDWVIM